MVTRLTPRRLAAAVMVISNGWSGTAAWLCGDRPSNMSITASANFVDTVWSFVKASLTISLVVEFI